MPVCKLDGPLLSPSLGSHVVQHGFKRSSQIYCNYVGIGWDPWGFLQRCLPRGQFS